MTFFSSKAYNGVIIHILNTAYCSSLGVKYFILMAVTLVHLLEYTD